MIGFSKTLIFIGLTITAVGIFLYLLHKLDADSFNWFGNLPLDIKFERENFRFYFPLGSSLLLSLVLSALWYFLRILSHFLTNFLTHIKH